MPAWRAVLAGCALALVFAVPAKAGDGEGRVSADWTVGSRAYRELRARAAFDLADSASLAARASVYRSDEVNGTYKLFGLRGGYEPGRWSFGLDAAVQPRVDGYEKSSLGGDAAYSFPLSGDDGNAALDLGGGVALTRHSDQLASEPRSGPGRGAKRAEEFVVRESDLFVFGAVRTPAATLSGRAMTSSYDRDLAGESARRVLSVGEAFDGAVFGFPRSSLMAKIRVEALPRLEPFASWTHTTFALGDPPSNALAAGATVFLGRIDATASVERYRQRGFPDRNYLSLGASLGF